MLSERVIVTHQHFVDRYLLYLFYKGKEKIEDKQVNNDFLLKLKNVSLFVVINSSSVTGLPGLTLFLLREPEVRGTTFKT